jgi:hypothetical protein
VAHGLKRRRVPPSLVSSCIVVEGISCYATYATVASFSFLLVLDRHLEQSRRSLMLLFVTALTALSLAAAILLARGGWRSEADRASPWSRIESIISQADRRLLLDVRLLTETFLFQTAIFGCHVLTLFAAGRAVGPSFALEAAFLASASRASLRHFHQSLSGLASSRAPA